MKPRKVEIRMEVETDDPLFVLRDKSKWGYYPRGYSFNTKILKIQAKVKKKGE